MQTNQNSRILRPIRSFVRRQGRLTKGQQLALDNYWPSMGIGLPIDPPLTLKPYLRKQRH